MVCGPTREAEARARILLRLHGSLPTAFRQALHDWQKWTGRADVTLALVDCAAKEERLGHSAQAGTRGRASGNGRHDEALEDALPAKIRVRQR